MSSYDENKVFSSLQTLDTNQDGRIPIEEFTYFLT